MRRDGDRDRRVDACQLLDRDRVGERVGAAAAVGLRDRHAHQAELGHFGDELVRKALLAVELLRDRRDALDREPAHRLAEERVLVVEIEVEAQRGATLPGNARGPLRYGFGVVRPANKKEHQNRGSKGFLRQPPVDRG